MEAKFKSGDRVRLKSKDEIKQYENPVVIWGSIKAQYCNKILTIRTVRISYRGFYYDTYEAVSSSGSMGGWHVLFDERWLEKIDEKIHEVSKDDLNKLLE